MLDNRRRKAVTAIGEQGRAEMLFFLPLGLTRFRDDAHKMNMISGNDQTSSRLPAFSLLSPEAVKQPRPSRSALSGAPGQQILRSGGPRSHFWQVGEPAHPKLFLSGTLLIVRHCPHTRFAIIAGEMAASGGLAVPWLRVTPEIAGFPRPYCFRPARDILHATSQDRGGFSPLPQSGKFSGRR